MRFILNLNSEIYRRLFDMIENENVLLKDTFLNE